MSDNLRMDIAIVGQDQASAAIREADASLKRLVATLTKAQAAMREAGTAWASSLDMIAATAKASTTSAAGSIEQLRKAVTADTVAIERSVAGTFLPLAEGATTATTTTTTRFSEMRAAIVGEIDTMRAGLASTFAPLSEGMAVAAEAVTAGANTMRGALDGVLANVRAVAAEMRAIAVPTSGTVPRSANANLRRAANRGHGGPHYRADWVRVPGGHLSLGSGPVVAGAAVGGYAIYEAMKAQDEALRTALTSPADAAMLGLTPDAYQKRIMAGSAETGASVSDVAEAYRTATRATQGVPTEDRLGLIDALLPKAQAEAKLKGATLPESLEALIGLSHMTGKYDIDSVKAMANKFSIASLSVNASLPEFSKTLGYSLPTLNAGLGIDEDTIIALTSALYGSGIKSTRSGTWVRSFYQGALKNGIDKHDNALAVLGLSDRKDWEVTGPDGKQDWGASTSRMAEILRQRTAGMSEEEKAKNLHAAFGERGSSVAALLTQKGIQDQYDGIRAKITSGAETDLFQKYSEGSSLMEAQRTWRDTQNLLIDIGQTALPAVNTGLRDLDALVKEIAAAMSGNWQGLAKDLFDHLIKPDLGPFGKDAGKDLPTLQERWKSMQGGYHPTADITWDEGNGGGGYGWTDALRIWASQALDLAELKKTVTGPQLATLKAIETDLQTMGAGVAAALAQAMGGISGTAGAIQASFETGGGSSGVAGASGGFAGFGGGKASPGRWWTPDRMQHAKRRLMAEAGLSDAGAEALVARWSSVEAAGGPLSVNPKSGAAGIGQWLGERRRGFGGDFDSQIGHAIAELNGSERRAGDALRQARNHDEGARGASMYERAEGYSNRTGVDHYTGRTISAAKAVHDSIRGTATAPRITAPPLTSAEDIAAHSRGAARGDTVHHHHGNMIVNGAGDPETVAKRIIASIDRRINRSSHDVYVDI